MANAFIQHLDPLNKAAEERRYLKDEKSGDLAQDGFHTLQAANPENPYDRSRPGIAPRCYEYPNVAHDEDT